MKLVYRCCAGLDIRREQSAHVCGGLSRGRAEAVIEEQVLGTFTQDLERLLAWLRKNKVRQVAMDSTRGLLDSGLECSWRPASS